MVDPKNVKASNPKDAVGARKVPMSFVPSGVLQEVAVGMFEGGLKYGRHNYRAIGVRASVYYDAAMRHLMAYWEGEDIDPDSGLSHITKAITSLVVMRDAMLHGKFYDDRPPRPNEDMVYHVEVMNTACEELLAKYPDPVPPHVHED